MWGKCEKPKSGKNVKNSRGKILEKIGSEKTWINDLEEMKSVEKCECGKKRNKFLWKNITYLVVHTLPNNSEVETHLECIILL